MDLLEKKVFENNGQSVIRHPWELAREMIIKKVIGQNYKSRKPNLLDVGCGDGYIVSSIANKFVEGTFKGVDIELREDELETMNQLAPSNLRFYSDLKNIEPKASSINGFTLMDVLEHVPDDVYLLNQLKPLSSQSEAAIYFISVPAWQFLFSNHDVFLKHYRRYTRRTLNKMIESADLKKIETHYFFFSLFMARAIKNVLLKILNKKETINATDLVWKFGNSSAKAVAKILYCEYLFMRFLSKLGIHLPGLSLFGLCKK
jgi:2-polyprenyl-3-methyl-5-hydroxy-6-metoxy-1,4-benzoquinol methylase